MRFSFYFLLPMALICQQASPELPDELAQPQRRITGEELANWVIKANPSLHAMRAAAKAAEHRIATAGVLDDPMFGYGIAPLTLTGRLNQKLDYSQKIPWPGTLQARKDVARFDAVAAANDVTVLRLTIIAQVKSALAEWRFVDAALVINDASRALLDQLIITAQTRYASGRGLKQDVLQAEVERGLVDKHLLFLQREQAIVQAKINALLNRSPDASLPQAAPITILAAPPPLAELSAAARSQHPVLTRLHAQLSASKSSIILAEKAFYPDFQIGATYNGVMDAARKRPLVGVSINVPVNRTRRRAELHRVQAQAQQKQWMLDAQRADLLSDIAQARAQVVEALGAITLYKQQLVPLADEYLAAAIADYQSGDGAFINVITAEQRNLSTDLALARSQADYERRLAVLERTLGSPISSLQPAATGEQP